MISPGFNVFSKKSQGIPEFYGDDIALLKLTQKVKMSTHARCRGLGWEGTLYRGGCPGEPWKRGHQGWASVTLALLLRPICLPCTVGANLALRKLPGSTCRDHGERWTRCWRDWHQGLGGDIVGCAAVPRSGCWVKGPALTSLSLTAEKELLNQVSIPAHFVALNGDKLNINLKTGSEVRVSGSGCC